MREKTHKLIYTAIGKPFIYVIALCFLLTCVYLATSQEKVEKSKATILADRLEIKDNGVSCNTSLPEKDKSKLTETKMQVKDGNIIKLNFNLSEHDFSKESSSLLEYTIECNNEIKKEFGDTYSSDTIWIDASEPNFNVTTSLLSPNKLKVELYQADNSKWNKQIDPSYSFQIVDDLKATPLNQTHFALIWCDEGANTIGFQTFLTNGTNASSPVIVDSNVGSCDLNRGSVGITTINSTHVAVFWADTGANSYFWEIMHTSGTVVGSAITITNNAGASNYQTGDIAMLNSTYLVVGYANYTTDYALLGQTYYTNGTLVNNFVFNATIYLGSTIRLEGINSSLFAAAYDLATPAGQYAHIYNYDGTDYNAPYKLIGVDDSYTFDIAALNTSNLAGYGFFAAAVATGNISNYDIQSKSELANYLIDDYNNNRVKNEMTRVNESVIALISRTNTGTLNNITYMAYQLNGSSVGSYLNIPTVTEHNWTRINNANDLNTGSFAYDIISTQLVNNVTLCPDRVIAIFTNATAAPNYLTIKPLYLNGTEWSGFCSGAPSISLQNNFTNWTAGHKFNVTANVTDLDGATDIVKVTTNVSECSLIGNSSSGNNFGAVFTCTGAALVSRSLVITFTDASSQQASTSASANQYPNQNPISSVVRLNDTSFTKPETIYAWGNATDADSDSMTYYYAFANSTATLQNSTNSSFNCNAYAGCRHGVLNISFWAGDGVSNSSKVYNSTAILNTIPTGNLAYNVTNGSSFYAAATILISNISDIDSDTLYCEFWDGTLAKNDSSCIFTANWTSYGLKNINVNVSDGFAYSHYAFLQYNFLATPVEETAPAAAASTHHISVQTMELNASLYSSSVKKSCQTGNNVTLGNYIVTSTSGQEICVQCAGELKISNGKYYCESCPAGQFDTNLNQCILTPKQTLNKWLFDDIAKRIDAQNPMRGLGIFIILTGLVAYGVFSIFSGGKRK